MNLKKKKNANKILMTAAITSLLLMGTSVIPTQAHAGGNDLQHKNVTGNKDSIKKDTKSNKGKSTPKPG